MTYILNLPAGFAQTTLFFSGTAVPLGAAITLGHQLTGTGQSPASVAGVVAGAWGANTFVTGNGWSPNLQLNSILCKFGPLATGPSALVPIGTNPGLGAGDDYSPNAAVLVKKFTAIGGRHGQGRMFLPPFPEGAIGAGGNITGALVTTNNTRLAALLVSLNSGSVPAHLLHRYDPSLGQSPMAPTAITSLVMDGKLATQRRRLRR